MRFSTSSIRSLRAITSILLLWLMSTVPAGAAPSRRGPVGAVCDAQTLTLHNLRHQPRAFGGPRKTLTPRAIALITDTSSHLQHTSRTQDNDDAAIQNDAPAARIDDDEQQIPSLQPLGVLHRARDQHPRSRTFFPRSPRGPPTHV
jgi:hypothetical protein